MLKAKNFHDIKKALKALFNGTFSFFVFGFFFSVQDKIVKVYVFMLFIFYLLPFSSSKTLHDNSTESWQSSESGRLSVKS